MSHGFKDSGYEIAGSRMGNICETCGEGMNHSNHEYKPPVPTHAPKTDTPATQERCTAVDDKGYWWGADVICPTEPDFIPGKGIWMPNQVRCRYVAEVNGLCGKHDFIRKHEEASNG